MALGEKPVHDRLLEAAMNQLDVILSVPDIQSFPSELRERFPHLNKKLIKRESYRDTIANMTYIDVISAVEEIFNLCHNVTISFENSR
jgi:hypothetical protein